jgi:ABC-2 type transport system permease protein
MFNKARIYLATMWAECMKEWKIELTYKADFIRTLIDPFVYVLPYLLFGLALVGGRRSSSLFKLAGTYDIVTFVVLGYIFMGFLNTALWAMGFALRKEQFYGTLEAVFVSPMPRWVIVGGMAMHSTMHQGLIIATQLVLLNFIFRLTLNIGGTLPGLAVVGLMLLALYGMGTMMAALALIFKEGWIVSEILSSIVNVITPVAYPLAILPLFMQKASMILPTTYGIITMRHFLIGEKLPFSVGTAFLRLVLLTVFWIGFGLVVFAIIDRKTRREGTLGHY